MNNKYDLSHLTQEPAQTLLGPVQDDEALLLYATLKVMRLETVLEIGCFEGYSATNFLKATEDWNGTVYSCDIDPKYVTKINDRHFVILKDTRYLTKEDIHNKHIDMIFFDCHNYEAQMCCFDNLRAVGCITDKTVIAIHDTHTHPIQLHPAYYPTSQGFVHCPMERQMVNDFVSMGYHAFCFHTDLKIHNEKLPFRHGVTLLKKFTPLVV